MYLSRFYKLRIISFCLILLASTLTVFMDARPVEAVTGSDWKAGNIIDDSLFIDKDSMSVAEIQQFLNTKVPACDTNGTQSVTYRYNSSTGRLGDDRDPFTTTTRAVYGNRYSSWHGVDDGKAPYTCLDEYYEVPKTTPGPGFPASNYGGKPIPSGAKSAARLIWEAGQEYSISPKVLLVTLQKEQGLLSDTWPFKGQYYYAMGAHCPDGPNGAECDPDYASFSLQMRESARLFRYYLDNMQEDWWSYKKPYQTNFIYWNVTYSGCGGSNVYIQNSATAALYTYTPYQPNQAALNNLYGTGDGCSAYGNRNFWRMYNDWFGTTSASVLFKISGSSTYYLEWGDFYYPIASGEILSAYGLTNVAPRTVNAAPADKNRGPLLTTTAKFGSEDPNDPYYTATINVIDAGKKHPAPNWYTLSQHGVSNYTVYDSTLGLLLKTGDSLRPVVRKPNGATLLLQSNKRRGFPDSETYYSLSGPNYLQQEQIYGHQQVTRMSASYITSKAVGAPMLLDGKFIKPSDSPAIYLFDKGVKRLFSASTYSLWGGKTDYVFPGEQVSQIALGSPAPHLAISDANELYLVDSGKKYLFDSAGQTAWSLTVGDFSNVSDKALARLTTESAVPTLITDDRPGVFFVENGEKHGVPSLKDFSRLGFSWNNVENLSRTSLGLLPRGADIYAPGALARTPNGAVFMLDSNYRAHGVTSGELFIRFGFSWSNVKNVSSNGLNGFTFDSLKTVLHDDINNKYYLVDKGITYSVSETNAGSGVYDLVSREFTVIDTKVLETLNTAKSITRFVRGSNPTVFYIENGTKRPIATEQAFYDAGGTWSQVTDVSDTFLEEIPRGAKL